MDNVVQENYDDGEFKMIFDKIEQLLEDCYAEKSVTYINRNIYL